MIKVFGQTDRAFASNGDVVLRPYKAKVHKEDNGAYYVDIEVGIEYAEHIVAGNIVVVNTPDGYQAFRITNPQKTRKRISFRAKHVFYDAENYMIADSYVVLKNGNGALSHLNSATDENSPFTVFSDVQTVNSIRIVRKPLAEAVFDVMERWGGHIVRDNYTIGLKQEIGQDNGVTVRYAKNLREITCEEDWNDVVTKLLPVGKDGCLLNAVDSLADLYVYATKQYSIPYTKTITFSQYLNREDYGSDEAYKKALVADLKTQATAYVEAHSVPSVNYTLSANIDKITDVGDRIEVIDERLGLDLFTNIISYDYDCLLKQFTEIEFGNFRKKLSNLFEIVNQNIDKTVAVAETNLSGDTEIKIDAVNQSIAEVNESLTETINNTNEDLTNRINALADELYINEGETMTVAFVTVAGFLGDNAETLTFSVVTPKLMPSAVSLTDLRLNIYNTDGTFAIPYNADGNDILSDSSITVSGILASENTMTITLAKSFTGTANTPVTVYITNIELSMQNEEA